MVVLADGLGGEPREGGTLLTGGRAEGEFVDAGHGGSHFLARVLATAKMNAITRM